MLSVLIRRWWIPLLKGVCAMLFGAAVFLWTRTTIWGLVMSFGVYCVADGMLSFALARNMQTRRDKLWPGLWGAGCFSLCAGGIALIWPDMGIEWLIIVVAFWAMWLGIFEIVASLLVRKLIPNECLLLLVGASSILLNLTLLMSLVLAVPAARWIIGFNIAIRGGLLIAMGLQLRACKQAYSLRAFPRSSFSWSILRYSISSMEETKRRGEAH